MTPLIEGTVHHFEFRGLYDGATILMDRESGSLWHHISGISLDGPHAGRQLPIYNLYHMTVEDALEAFPNLEVALSDRPIRGQESRWSPWFERIPVLGARFTDTMSPQDNRKPTMDVGLGVFNADAAKYYSMGDVAASDHIVIDEFAGRRLAVFYRPGARAIHAFYIDASSAVWDGTTLRFDTGHQYRDGVLYDMTDSAIALERPLQLFTRWYGFSLTYPHTQVYER